MLTCSFQSDYQTILLRNSRHQLWHIERSFPSLGEEERQHLLQYTSVQMLELQEVRDLLMTEKTPFTTN